MNTNTDPNKKYQISISLKMIAIIELAINALLVRKADETLKNKKIHDPEILSALEHIKGHEKQMLEALNIIPGEALIQAVNEFSDAIKENKDASIARSSKIKEMKEKVEDTSSEKLVKKFMF